MAGYRKTKHVAIMCNLVEKCHKHLHAANVILMKAQRRTVSDQVQQASRKDPVKQLLLKKSNCSHYKTKNDR